MYNTCCTEYRIRGLRFFGFKDEINDSLSGVILYLVPTRICSHKRLLQEEEAFSEIDRSTSKRLTIIC